jgi:mannose-1-phosphate guanylyltransferase
MKAFLLCGGKGVRLRPLTDKIPKVLLPIKGKPLLEIWLEKCQKYGVSEVLINAHHLAGRLESYINKNKNKFNLKINYVYEKKLRGTGGTIKENFDFVRGEEQFYIIHADNFTNINLLKFLEFHVKKSLLSVALFHTKFPQQCGIVEKIRKDGLILSFREKPIDATSNLASAAIFIASPLIIKDFPKRKKFFDFTTEILPKFIGRMYGYIMDGFNIDIGTPEGYADANRVHWDDISEVL